MNREELIKLKQDNRENKIIYNLLSTLIGECDKSKGTDEEYSQVTSKVIQKMFNNNELSIRLGKSIGADVEYLCVENEFLEEYIPTLLTEEQITTIIKENCEGVDLGSTMKYFKSNYAGRYDGRTVSQIAREYLKIE